MSASLFWEQAKNKAFLTHLILFLIVVCCSTINTSFAQETQTAINWISFEEAKAAFTKEQKPIIINFYDSKNDSCHMMMDSVYSDPVIISYMNQYFYNIHFDIHSKKKISFFDGKTYSPSPKKHSLAQNLAGDVSLPAILLFTKQAKGTAYNGYIDKHRMLGHLLYYAEAVHKSTEWDDFYAEYTATFPREKGKGFTIVRTVVNWMSMEEAIEKQQKAPRPIYLDIFANWKNTSTVMLVSTYANDTIASILNNEFYPVRFEATTRDTMRLKGTVFTNPGKTKEEKHLHDFASTLLLSNKKGFSFPTLIIFERKVAKPIHFYQHFFGKKSLEAMLRFYSTDAYKKQNYSQFSTNYWKQKEKP